MRKRPSANLRRQVFKRARGLCEYCYCPQEFSPSPFDCDHITPVKKGGETSSRNLACACRGCNGKKLDSIAAADPISGKVVPLYHPRMDNWIEHFRWSDDYLKLVGISLSGRATIAKLDLNRPNIINLRHALIVIREHPPAPIEN